MALPRVVIDGRMATEPELRFLPSGVAVANFRVAASERKLNAQTNQWEDGRQCFISVTCWRDTAENVTESLHQGDPVVLEGRLYQREYERDGQKQYAFQIDADSIGPGLRNATARVQRSQRSQGGQQGQQDPWATPAPQGQQRGAQAQQQPSQQGWQQQNQQGWGNQPNFEGEPPF